MKGQFIAAGLSAILPGVGQLYNHQWLKGGLFLVAIMVVSGVIRRRAIFEGGVGIGLIVAVVLFGIAIWSVADAFQGVKAHEGS